MNQKEWRFMVRCAHHANIRTKIQEQWRIPSVFILLSKSGDWEVQNWKRNSFKKNFRSLSKNTVVGKLERKVCINILVLNSLLYSS